MHEGPDGVPHKASETAAVIEPRGAVTSRVVLAGGGATGSTRRLALLTIPRFDRAVAAVAVSGAIGIVLAETRFASAVIVASLTGAGWTAHARPRRRAPAVVAAVVLIFPFGRFASVGATGSPAAIGRIWNALSRGLAQTGHGRVAGPSLKILQGRACSQGTIGGRVPSPRGARAASDTGRTADGCADIGKDLGADYVPGVDIRRPDGVADYRGCAFQHVKVAQEPASRVHLRGLDRRGRPGSDPPPPIGDPGASAVFYVDVVL